MGLELCIKAQQAIKVAGQVDEELDDFIIATQIVVQEKAEKKLANSEQTKFFKRWTETRNQKFPLVLPQLPTGHEAISEDWASLKSNDEGFLNRFMLSLAIETNQVENVFTLSEASCLDLVKRGIPYGNVSCDDEIDGTTLQDHEVIKQIVNDTRAAYDLLEEVIKDPKALTRDLICKIHARLMKNSKLLPNHLTYVSPGVTRTATRKTVVISGTYSIECCPYAKVDDELDYICKMAKVSSDVTS
ncbi:hypothetical protein H0H92_008347 [Tricholoma furcatifolium]|nr:hypothetical protein H0H92_008347 [Tricholoma furcatifolium]